MQDAAIRPHRSPSPPRYRAISLAEVALGTFLVIGHNVFHIVSNEVPLLAGLFFFSFCIRDHGYKIPGFTRPKSWGKTILIALAAAAILQLGSELVVGPLAAHFWPEPQHISSLINGLAHNWKFALRNLVIIWVFAGFGEELGYRGYLLNRAADLGSRSKVRLHRRHVVRCGALRIRPFLQRRRRYR